MKSVTDPVSAVSSLTERKKDTESGDGPTYWIQLLGLGDSHVESKRQTIGDGCSPVP
jgi:hypothetical protein